MLQILGAALCNIISPASRRPGFVHPYLLHIVKNCESMIFCRLWGNVADLGSFFKGGTRITYLWWKNVLINKEYDLGRAWNPEYIPFFRDSKVISALIDFSVDVCSECTSTSFVRASSNSYFCNWNSSGSYLPPQWAWIQSIQLNKPAQLLNS
jgi:hypothetical protein